MPRLLLAVALLALAHPALAQTFPLRTIQIIVPFAAGASSDATARAVAAEWAPRLGVSVVVENKGGGGGITGLQAMARAAPDGHTLAIGAGGATVIIPMLPGAPQFDPVREMVPVAKLVDAPLVIVAHREKGPTSLADAIARAKASPDGLTYGSTGTNSLMHLAVEFLAFKAGAKLVHVPYRGSAPAAMDVVAGQVPFVAVDLTSVNPQIQAGTLRGLAVIGWQRTPFAPEIPTMAEAGFPGHGSASFLGLFAPAGTPPAIVKAISDHMRESVAKPEVQRQMRNSALEPAYLDAAGFDAMLTEERQRWRGILKSIGKID